MPVTFRGTTLRNTTYLSQWSPQQLFTSNEQGVWFDPSDMSTMFQDAAGTTPVTAMEQPVGLALDKRKPVAQTGYNSVYFDGTNDYLTAAANSGALGSGDFTIEVWTYLTARVNDYPCIWGNYSTFAAGSLSLFAGHGSATNTRYQVAVNGSGFPNIQSSISVAYNRWVHLAVVRASGVITLYIDGVADGTFSSSATLSGTTGSSWIGAAGDSLTTGEIQGSLSNLRVVVGTAVYTSNFTPPTAPLTAISGTALLTCQNTTIVDNSLNAVSISALGDAKTGKANPFGSHLNQSTAASRPVLSARYNLLRYTEQFDNAVWQKGAVHTSTELNMANVTATTDPLGGNTADKLQENTDNAEHYIVQTVTVTAAQHTFSVYLKAAERTWASIYFSTGPITSTWFNLAADGSGGVGTVASGFTATSTYVGNGWYRCSITGTSTAGSWSVIINPALGNGVSVVYAGTLGYGIYMWGADLRVTNDGVGLPSYQRVNTSTDYDTIGFPPYLRFDGVDDSLVSGTVNFSTTDKLSVFSGIRKLSDSNMATVVELSASSDAPNTFGLNAPGSSPAKYIAISRGTSAVFPSTNDAQYSAPHTGVISLINDISGDFSVLRINTNQAAQSTGDQGTGNFSNAPLYIGSRAGTTRFFNGRLYSLIVCGALEGSGEINNTETWINNKTRAY